MSLFKRLTFNLWYFRHPPWDTGISPPELVDFIHSHPPGKALDLGCGTGTNVIYLAKHGWQVTGIDFAIPAIRQAQRKARQAGIQADLHVQDVTHLENMPGPFDLILDIGCFHNLDPQQRQDYRVNLERLLAPGGSFLLYSFLRTENGDGRGLGPEDLDLFTRQLELVSRQDGSERGRRPSTWLTYRKP